ncbi:MAG: acyl-ACP--UDP-N-acetylglucosamine O-acyltransferase [Alphaproteobacteria bacterium]|nr:acyl-ACP--UDP-N-acetylglucosamine O-acyltransferase [Alphaproteobacteria bacterium]
MAFIHPTAIIETGATLASGAHVGPFCVVGKDVTIETGVKLHSHVVLGGITHIGANTEVYPFASLGLAPQDLKYAGEPSRLEIGENNTIREHVTMNPGTEGGGMLTKVGDNCLFMVGAHVAHDCHIGNNVILANNATIAGHVVIEDYAIIGGLSAIHQFCRIGRHAMVGGMSGVERDVIPYGSVMGDRARLAGLNLVGLKRRQFERETIDHLRAAYRLLFAEEGTLKERVETVSGMFTGNEPIDEILGFVGAKTSRGICLPTQTGGTDSGSNGNGK